MRAKKKDLEVEIQTIAEKDGALQLRLNEFKKELQQKREAEKGAKKILAEAERKKDKLKKEAKTLVEEIEWLRANVAEYEEKHNERMKEISDVEKKVGALNAQM